MILHHALTLPWCHQDHVVRVVRLAINIFHNHYIYMNCIIIDENEAGTHFEEWGSWQVTGLISVGRGASCGRNASVVARLAICPNDVGDAG